MIVLICFFPIVVTTVDGLAAVDPEQLKLLRTLDASRWQAFRFAELPGGAAGRAQRSPDRAGGRGDRRCTSPRSQPRDGTYAGLGHEIVTDLQGLRPPRAWAATRGAVRCSPSRASTRSPSPSAVWRRGPSDREETPVETPRHAVRRGIARGPAGRVLLRARPDGLRRQAGGDLTPASTKPFTVMLDCFPNADHAALYLRSPTAISARSAWTCSLSSPPKRPNR